MTVQVLLADGLGDTNDSAIFPGQCQNKGIKKKKKKGFMFKVGNLDLTS